MRYLKVLKIVLDNNNYQHRVVVSSRRKNPKQAKTRIERNMGPWHGIGAAEKNADTGSLGESAFYTWAA